MLLGEGGKPDTASTSSCFPDDPPPTHPPAPAGAGQDIMDESGPKGTDASGNPILQARPGVQLPVATVMWQCLLGAICTPLASCGQQHGACTRRSSLAPTCLLCKPTARCCCPAPLFAPLQDIGVFLRDVFRQRFKGVDIKYIGEGAETGWNGWRSFC